MHMKNLKKSSFTLIELVVAILVIGIVMTSIPMLLSSSTKMEEVTAKERSFFNAFALITLIQTQEWDENNTKGDNYYKVLTAKGGDDELKCPRDGTLALDNESGADCDDNTTSHIGIDSGENKDDEATFDDIDDFNNFSTLVNDINITVHIRYMKDDTDYSKKNIYFNENNDLASGTNLKFLELNITDSDTHEVISILKYITANIGSVKIESRQE